MRIIAGKYKGRKLETPLDKRIRPTGEKVKEAIFSAILPYINDAVCCDLFAGTAGLGLEALSRGGKKCYFVDIDRTAIALIKNNIAKCNAEGDSVVIFGDYNKGLKRINEKIDVFFLDPPYHDGLYEKVINSIDLLDLLSDEGIIVSEHPKEVVLPEEIGRLTVAKSKNYGKTVVTYYIKKETR